VATRKWVEANPKQAAAFAASIQEATALAQQDKEVIRKANLKYIPFPPEVQAKFPDARYRAVVPVEAVEKWNAIALEQAMLKKPIDPAKILWKP
jgi:ABC-type nitrate/sulfonate/bicarbonate transport system substrate-binding protein